MAEKNMQRSPDASATGSKRAKQADDELAREDQQQRSSRGAFAPARESQREPEGKRKPEDEDPFKNQFEDEEDREESQEQQEEE